jgi:uncharacterized Zn finger protein (UPF0148 family)
MYQCECGFKFFEIHDGSLKCGKCHLEFRVSGFPSPDRFNREKHYFINMNSKIAVLKK